VFACGHVQQSNDSHCYVLYNSRSFVFPSRSLMCLSLAVNLNEEKREERNMKLIMYVMTIHSFCNFFSYV
jgi:hypothetical protein